MNSDKWLFLKEIFPAAWRLESPALFSMQDKEGVLDWDVKSSVIDHDRWDCVLVSNGLELHQTFRRFPGEKAVEVQVTLKNTRSGSVRLNELKLIDLSFSAEQGPVTFRTLDGGANVKNYPPDLFQVHDVLCDGVSEIWKEHGWGGRSSDDTLPLMAFSMGEGALITGLEWSGLWFGSLKGKSCGGEASVDLFVRIPIKGLEIQAGETFELPAAHLIFSDEGLAGAGNACRRYLAEQVIPPLDGTTNGNSPVVYNHWFGLGPNINEAVLMKQADRAADLGVDYFILDAGWYGGCNGDDFESGVGNWEKIDEKKFPRGLQPLARHVQAVGLKFGIWFEPERAHVQSEFYRAHPDWFFTLGDETENSHVHLNLAIPEAQQEIVRLMSARIDELDVKWIKWDYNINPKAYWERKDPSGRLMFDAMNGLYAVQDELLRRHPNVVFECCASGGRRIDLGQLRRTHTSLLSDSCTSSLVCRFMQQGATVFLPASYLGAGIGFGGIEFDENITEGVLDDWQLLSRMLGVPILFGDIAALSDEKCAVIQRNIESFRSWRHLLKQDVFELLPQPHHSTDLAAIEFINPSKEEAIIFIFSGPQKAQDPQQIRPQALDPSAHYQVERVGGVSLEWVGGRGDELMEKGWSVDLDSRQAVVIRLFKQVS